MADEQDNDERAHSGQGKVTPFPRERIVRPEKARPPTTAEYHSVWQSWLASQQQSALNTQEAAAAAVSATELPCLTYASQKVPELAELLKKFSIGGDELAVFAEPQLGHYIHGEIEQSRREHLRVLTDMHPALKVLAVELAAAAKIDIHYGMAYASNIIAPAPAVGEALKQSTAEIHQFFDVYELKEFARDALLSAFHAGICDRLTDMGFMQR